MEEKFYFILVYLTLTNGKSWKVPFEKKVFMMSLKNTFFIKLLKVFSKEDSISTNQLITSIIIHK